MNNAADIDTYFAAFIATTQLALQQVREAVKHAAPDAQEVISYGMPAFKMNNVLIYFAGYERHVGFYPGAAAIAEFKNDIARYKSAKGSVQFKLSEPMPLELVKRITAFRLADDARKKNRSVSGQGI